LKEHRHSHPHMVPYIGNGLYCYANATAMLLASIGEDVPPSQIEVLTGVGLGAFWIREARLIFFSSTPPDIGVSKALELLGFAYTERSRQEGEPAPLDELRRDLAKGAVVLGPLDMGYLDYLPYHANAAGVDHYVLAYAMDDQVHLHDPDGYPHVSLSLEQLALAWKAERVDYRRGAYRCWTAPKRIDHPSQAKIYEQALAFFRSAYQHIDDTPSVGRNGIPTLQVGYDAILACADRVQRGEISARERGHLTGFAFPLGAKRALDFATFFDPGDAQLAVLKREQAGLFGRCHTLAMRKEWPSLADALQQLADVEKEFRTALLARHELPTTPG